MIHPKICRDRLRKKRPTEGQVEAPGIGLSAGQVPAPSSHGGDPPLPCPRPAQGFREGAQPGF